MKNRLNEDSLTDYRRTTLWLRVWGGLLLELDVWHPLNISERERVALLAKHAAQGVKVIRELTGSTAPIVQGQYKDALRPGREILIGTEVNERKLSVLP